MIKITLSKTKAPSQLARKMPAIAAAAIKDAAKNWRAEILPKHFQAGAAIRYRYQPRMPKYQNRKRKMGSPPALVYTGKAMRKILADRREPTGTAKKITLRIASVGFFKYNYPSWPSGHTMANELTAMSNEDLKKIYTDTQESMIKRMNAAQENDQRRFR